MHYWLNLLYKWCLNISKIIVDTDDSGITILFKQKTTTNKNSKDLFDERIFCHVATR